MKNSLKLAFAASVVNFLALTVAPFVSGAQVIRIPFVMGAASTTEQVYDFGDVQVGQYVTTTFQYKNSTGGPLGIVDSTAEGVDLVGTDCQALLPAQGTCNITIGFLVTAEGYNQGAVKINTDKGSQPDVLTVKANGVTSGQILTISPNSKQYSVLNQEENFTITNDKPYDITISNIMMSNNYWTVTSNSCVGKLAAGSSCKTTAKYINKKTGSYSGTLKVISQSVTVGSSALTGNTALGVATFTSNDITAQDLKVNQVYTDSVTLKNTGAGPMSISNVGLDLTSPYFTITNNSCTGKSLAPQETCSVDFKIVFNSPNVLQRAFVFSLSNASSSVASLNVYASATSATSLLSINPSSITFSDQVIGSTSAPQQIVLKSVGNTPVNVTNISLTGDSSLFAVLNKSDCIGTLSPEQQCILNITYGGTTKAGSNSATLNLASNVTTPVTPVPLKGTSIAPVLSAVPTSITITGTAGTDYFQNVTVTNTSSVASVLKTIVSSNPNITLDGSTCVANYNLSAGGSCIIKVNIAKSVAAGTGSSSITLTHTGTNVSVPVNYSLTPLKIDPQVSEISCPTVSAFTGTGAAPSTTKGIDSCTISVTNVSKTTPLFVPIGGISKEKASSSLFNSSADEVTTPVTIAPGATVSFNIGHQIPSTAGVTTGVFNISTTPVLNSADLTSSVQKTATFAVVDPLFEVLNKGCTPSTSVGSSIVCLFQVKNNSLSKYSVIAPLASKKSVILAPKFSESKLNNSLFSTQFTEKPVDDYSPTATQFQWSLLNSSCATLGSTMSGGIVASDYCSVALQIKPSKVGNYNIPIYLVPGVGAPVKADLNASFSIVELATGNLGAVTCPALSVGTKGVCTATLSNPSTATALKINSMSIAADPSGTFGSPTSNCGGSLAAKASCTVSIPVTGVASGSFNTVLTANTGAGVYTSTATINVAVASPLVTLNNFVCPSTTESVGVTCTATLKNNGIVPFNISNIDVVNKSVGFGTVTSSTNAVAPGAVATLTLPFVNSVVGTYTTSIKISASGYTDVSTNASVRVSAAPAAVGTLSPLMCDSVYHSQNGLCVATIKNTSSLKSLTINSITAKMNLNAIVPSHTCGSSLEPNASCTVSVPVSTPLVYSPVSAPLITLSVSTNPYLSQQTKLNIVPLSFAVVPSAAKSGFINTDIVSTTTFTNKNAFKVILPAKSISAGGSLIKIVADKCTNVELAPEQSCTVDTSFTSSLAGIREGQVTLKYGGAEISGKITVTFAVPTLNISPLGDLTKVDGIRSLSGNWYAVSNPNTVPVTLSSISVLTSASVVVADKSIPGSCFAGKVLSPLETCNIFERFNSGLGSGTSSPASNTGNVKTATSITAGWKSAWTTMKGSAVLDKTTATTYPGGSYTGVVKFTNNSLTTVKDIELVRTGVVNATSPTLSILDNTCGSAVFPNGNCSITFEIANFKSGANTISLDILGNYQTVINAKPTANWGERTSVANVSSITINTGAPTATIAAGAYGTSSIATSKFTNTSSYPIFVTSVDVTGAADQYLSGTTCLNAWVAPKATCDVTTTRQLQTGDLAIVRTPAKITVTAFNTYPFSTNLTISPVMTNAINFGRINFGSSSTKSIPLYNGASTPWTVSSVILPDSVKRVNTGATDCSTAASFTLAPGQKCDMRLTWSPADEGVFDDVMKLNNSWSGMPVITVNLSGVGVIPVGTVVHSVGCYGTEGIYDSVHGQIVTRLAMSSIDWNLGSTLNIPTAGFSTELLGAGYNLSTVKPYSIGGLENSIKAPGSGQCYYLSANTNSVPNPVADLYNAVPRMGNSYMQHAYSAAYDAYVRIAQFQGSIVDASGKNYITPPIRYVLSYKPRSSAAPSIYFDKAEPFVTKGSYYSRMRLMVNNDQSTVYVSYQEPGVFSKMYRLNPNNSNGLEQIYTSPRMGSGSTLPPAYSSVEAYLSHLWFGTIDANDSNIIWAHDGGSTIVKYNLATGEINQIANGVGRSYTDSQAMGPDGRMYFASRGNDSSYSIYYFDTKTKSINLLAKFAPKAWGLTVATVSKIIVSKNGRYLYIVGQGYWSKIKIME